MAEDRLDRIRRQGGAGIRTVSPPLVRRVHLSQESKFSYWHPARSSTRRSRPYSRCQTISYRRTTPFSGTVGGLAYCSDAPRPRPRAGRNGDARIWARYPLPDGSLRAGMGKSVAAARRWANNDSGSQ
jgi:hypothetical protein